MCFSPYSIYHQRTYCSRTSFDVEEVKRKYIFICIYFLLSFVRPTRACPRRNQRNTRTSFPSLTGNKIKKLYFHKVPYVALLSPCCTLVNLCRAGHPSFFTSHRVIGKELTSGIMIGLYSLTPPPPATHPSPLKGSVSRDF